MNNYYTLKLLLEEIESKIKCSRFLFAYTAVKNTLSLVFENQQKSYELQILSDKGRIACYLQEFYKESSGQKAYFFEALKDCDVIDFYQYENERAYILEFSNQKKLVITLFGSIANVFLTENQIVVKAYKQHKKWSNKRIEDIFPDFQRSDKEPRTPKQFILQNAPKLPRPFLDELIHYNNLNEKPFEEIIQIVQDWIQQIQTTPEPRLLTDHRFTILPHNLLPIDHKYSFDSLNEGIKRSWSVAVNESKLVEHRNEWISILQGRQRYLEGLISKAEQVSIQENQAETWLEFGHLIMTQPPQKVGLKSIRIPNYFKNNEEIEIPLKEELTLAENATRYYQRAANAKKSVDVILSQENQAKNYLEELKPVLLELVSCSRYNDWVSWRKKWDTYLKTVKSQKVEQNETEGFGVIPYKGFEFWLGRNAKSNEIVVQKAHKEDIWLHARGVGGSHVIIRMNKRKENPPHFILEAAASLAAWHSQAKGSHLVPVQFTKRKYIRKPKGGDTGMVKVDKEEVLMIEPKREIN